MRAFSASSVMHTFTWHATRNAKLPRNLKTHREWSTLDHNTVFPATLAMLRPGEMIGGKRVKAFGLPETCMQN